MTLKIELQKIHKKIQCTIPKHSVIFDTDTEEAVARGVGSCSIQNDDTAPLFELPDQLGRSVSISNLLKKGPIILNFYRGNWCPYCNLELRTLQSYLPKFESLGASLVAISPQVPNKSMTPAEKSELSFPVLSDSGNEVASQYGLVFTLSEELRSTYQEVGIDLPLYNGDDSFELPVPGTFIIGSDRKVKALHVNVDYKQRMDPEEILNSLRTL